MSAVPKMGEVYKHFKGNLYEIVTIAKHSETGEELVIYRALYGEGEVYARPLMDFTAKLSKEKYPEATQEYRFELQEIKEEALDPTVEKFLDADTYEERLQILDTMKETITDEMITTMAIVCDVEVPAGDLADRYENFKNCLTTLRKYECSRLR